MKKLLLLAAVLIIIASQAMLGHGVIQPDVSQARPDQARQYQAEAGTDKYGEKVIPTASFLNTDILYQENEGLIHRAASPDSIRAMVVPHHSLAAAYTAEAISLLAENGQEPKAIILLGPNHDNQGPIAATTALSWQTPFGLIESEPQIIEKLLDQGLVQQEDALFYKEHSMGTVLPWLAKYLPGVPVVPLIFHFDKAREKVGPIMQALEPWLDRGAVVIASIDFSHGLDQAGAEKKDRQMTQYLLENEYDKIAHLDSSYLDGPGILSAIMAYYAENTGLDLQILANTNGGLLHKIRPGEEVTSYFVLAY
jgi:AmmeMemoRadiSam system protein B